MRNIRSVLDFILIFGIYSSTKKLETAQCDDYAYFVKNFPANSLVQEFKTGVSTKTADFTAAKMKKYNKAMSKKKK